MKFGFWGQFRGSVCSRVGIEGKTSENHPFFPIQLLRFEVFRRFGRFEVQFSGSRFNFWGFGKFEFKYFQVRPNTMSK